MFIKTRIISTKSKLNHLVEASFQEVNRLFVSAFENDAQRASNKIYHLPNVEIKDYNVTIDGKKFFDQPVKNDKITHKNIRKTNTGQGHDYKTCCLLYYACFGNNYKMIATDLSKQQVLEMLILEQFNRLILLQI